MRVLLVHAHPVPDSFNKALARLAADTLKACGHEVRLLDLYELDFDPVMRKEERQGYHDQGSNVLPVREHLAHLAWCSGLVFVYPTWWYGQPAILKGWLDRVLVPHATFAMPEGNKPVQPLMQHIGCLGGISTYGAPWLFTRWVGDPGRRIVMRGLRSLIHPRAKTFWSALHKMDSVTAADRRAFMAKVKTRLESLPLDVPSQPCAMRLEG